jgi:hypothetical protein
MRLGAKTVCLLTVLIALLMTGYQYLRLKSNRAGAISPQVDLERFFTGQAETDERLHRLEVVNVRIRKRQEIVKDVATGHMSLFDAAAYFKQLNKDSRLLNLLDHYPGATDNEHVCWQVIIWLDAFLTSELGMSASQKEEVLRRLEAELLEHVAGHGGKVILPGD